MKKSFSFVVGVSLILSGFLMVAQDSKVLASWLIDRSGTLVQVDPVVLGDNDTQEVEVEVEEEDESETSNSTTRAEEEKRELEKKVTEERREQLKKTEETKREQAKKELERQSEARKKQLELNKQIRKTEIAPTDRKLEVKQEVRNQDGKVAREVKRELPENEPLHIEREDGEKLEIKAIEGEEIELKGERVRTRTNFPITIGENNALIITKKDGTQKTVTYLPDAAVANLEAKGFTSVATDTDLEEGTNGEPVYKFEAQEEKRVLGLFRRKFKKSVEVSAENGEVVRSESTDSSTLSRLLERLSF